MLVAKGANHQNDGEVRRRDNLMSAPGPMQPIGFVGPSVIFLSDDGPTRSEALRDQSGRWAEHCIQIGRVRQPNTFKAHSDKKAASERY
jgi:hypothetical protein